MCCSSGDDISDLVNETQKSVSMFLSCSAMGPPGGGRNDITGRMTRHLNVISIDTFSDDTMTKIFSAITDLHFSNGFDASFVRLGE